MLVYGAITTARSSRARRSIVPMYARTGCARPCAKSITGSLILEPERQMSRPVERQVPEVQAQLYSVANFVSKGRRSTINTITQAALNVSYS